MAAAAVDLQALEDAIAAALGPTQRITAGHGWSEDVVTLTESQARLLAKVAEVVRRALVDQMPTTSPPASV